MKRFRNITTDRVGTIVHSRILYLPIEKIDGIAGEEEGTIIYIGGTFFMVEGNVEEVLDYIQDTARIELMPDVPKPAQFHSCPCCGQPLSTRKVKL